MDIHTSINLFLGRLACVLDMPALECTVKRFEVQESWDVRVRCRAMIAFIEVVCCDFPVVVAFELIRMVEHIVVKVQSFVTGLDVYVSEILFPCNLGYDLCVHVDPEEPISIDLFMYEMESVCRFSRLEMQISRSIPQVSVQSICPPAFTAYIRDDSENSIFDYRVLRVLTYVVEHADFMVLVASNDDIETRKLISKPFTRSLYSKGRGEEKPPVGEYSPTLKLEHLSSSIPRRR